jgi:hypothetical protein
MFLLLVAVVVETVLAAVLAAFYTRKTLICRQETPR